MKKIIAAVVVASFAGMSFNAAAAAAGKAPTTHKHAAKTTTHQTHKTTRQTHKTTHAKPHKKA
ncbi:MAG: hypothetical protein JWR16_2782 [Nevskia sp.]|nr:hypothetical protein [Nevskia sp.]